MTEHAQVAENVAALERRLAELERRREELIAELSESYTIVIVTHNMQQASRVSDRTAFFNVQPSEKGERIGYLVEYERTEAIFQDPQQEATKEYVSGRFG